MKLDCTFSNVKVAIEDYKAPFAFDQNVKKS